MFDEPVDNSGRRRQALHKVNVVLTPADPAGVAGPLMAPLTLSLLRSSPV